MQSCAPEFLKATRQSQPLNVRQIAVANIRDGALGVRALGQRKCSQLQTQQSEQGYRIAIMVIFHGHLMLFLQGKVQQQCLWVPNNPEIHFQSHIFQM